MDKGHLRHLPAEGLHQKGIMGAAHDHRVHPRIPEGGQIPLHRHYADGILRRKTVFHQRHKQGAGFAENHRFRALLPDGPLIAAAVDGGLGANDADALVPALGQGIVYGRLYDPQHGQGKGLPQYGQAVGADGAAGYDHRLHPLGKQKAHILAGIAGDGLRRAGAIGHPGNIPKIGELQPPCIAAYLVENRQPSQPAVKYADLGNRIHRISPCILSCI